MSDIFISYAHGDTDFVHSLVKPLEAETFRRGGITRFGRARSGKDIIVRGIEEAQGTNGAVDSAHVLINGVIWSRQ